MSVIFTHGYEKYSAFYIFYAMYQVIFNWVKCSTAFLRGVNVDVMSGSVFVWDFSSCGWSDQLCEYENKLQSGAENAVSACLDKPHTLSQFFYSIGSMHI